MIYTFSYIPTPLKFKTSSKSLMYGLLMKRGFQPEEIIVYSIFNRKLEKRLLSEDEAIKIVREELKVIFNDDEIRRIINQRSSTF